MKTLEKYWIVLIIGLFTWVPSFATWSIILIDPKTKEIGIAGASCSYNCYGIGKIAPGMGAIIVQAMSNNDARDMGFKLLMAKATPEQIITAMRSPEFDPEEQQYAVVTVQFLKAPKTYTGTVTKKFNGALTGEGFSVQGNTLTSAAELQIIMDVVIKGKKDGLPISEILMAALEAGSRAGGDNRCGEQRATSAFLTVARPIDKTPYIDLVIFGQQKGGPNAVGLLRLKYEKWMKKQAVQTSPSP